MTGLFAPGRVPAKRHPCNAECCATPRIVPTAYDGLRCEACVSVCWCLSTEETA